MDLLNIVSERLPDWIRNTGVGLAILEEQRAQQHAERQRPVDVLATLRRDLPAMVKKHDQIVEPLLAAALAAKAKFQAAEQKLIGAQHERQRALHGLRSHIARLENSLRASADPAIAEARRAIATRFDHERHSMFRSVGEPTGTIDYNLRPILKTVTNSHAIQRLHQARREADSALERLGTENPVDVAGAVAAIITSLDGAWDGVNQLDKFEPMVA